MKRWTMNVLRKIVIISMIAITVLFSTPNYSRAAGWADWGGTLLSPVVSLFSAFGDTIMQFLQWVMLGEASTEWDWSDLSWMPTHDEIEQYYGPEDGFPTKTEKAEDYPSNYRIPCIDYSPREIFAGVIPALDVNFINPNHPEDDKSISSQLQSTIASWYVGLRNFSLLILMVVLVYVGIRMMLTSLAAEKAKYKQMFLDWLIAMCLIFFLHYIMSFTLTMVETLTEALATNVTEVNVQVVGSEGEENVEFSTNLTGLARFRTQNSSSLANVMYLIIYLALVIYTLMFTITYLKRVLIMAFLTLIAPLVCMTYPIDKIGDGKAQAFSFWLREYIFNALLQPFHLLLYAVFVGSAFELASENMLYSLVALGFIFSAEKILRKMFGFEKSGTVSTLGAFAGGALMNNMLTQMGRIKGPAEKQLEEKEKANKVKPLKLDNGAYQGITSSNGDVASFGIGDDGSENVRIGTGTSNLTRGNAGTLNMQLGNMQDSSIQGGVQRTGITSGTSHRGGMTNSGGMAGVASFTRSLDGMSSIQPNRFTPTQRGAVVRKGGVANGIAQIIDTGAHRIGRKMTIRNTAKALQKGTKFLGKTALRAGLASGGLAAGIAAGIATGDLDNAIKMGIAGATAGSAAGKTASGYIGAAGNKIWKGAQENIINPYMEGAIGDFKEVKTQRDWKEFKNNKNKMNKLAEEFRHNDGTELSKAELNEVAQKAFMFQQSGINDIEDQIMGVKLQDEIQAKYRTQIDEDIRKQEEEMNALMSPTNGEPQIDEQQLRAMTEQEKTQLRASVDPTRIDESRMNAQEKAALKVDRRKVDILNKMEQLDKDKANKQINYQKSEARAQSEAITASQLAYQTQGMEDANVREHITQVLARQGNIPTQNIPATVQEIMRRKDFVTGLRKEL